MARSTDIVVIPRHRRWEVSVDGVTRPLVDWFATKERALDHAFEMAAETEATAVVVEDADGDVVAVHPVRVVQRAIACGSR